MSPKTRRPSLAPSSLTFQPMSRDFAYVSTTGQALSAIRRLGGHFTLNRFKRLETACESVHQLLAGREDAQRALIEVYSHCQKWRSASLLQSLVSLPDEMGRFEKQLSQLGVPQPAMSSPDDREIEAIAEAVLKILKNEQDREQAMNLTDHYAELFVSHVQTTLDLSLTMSPNLREECIKALRKLAVTAGALPPSLKIEKVTLIGTHPVAHGGYSDVFKGEWKDRLVAVKRPRSISGGDKLEALKQTRREIVLWRQLSGEHVVSLLGIFNEDIPSGLDSMVSEWMENGTLKTFLERPENRSTNRLRLMCQMSSALEYLHTHSPPIAHGDIKAGNIFIDANFRPVFGDFGLSCIRYTERTMSSTLDAGSARWMAPELLLPENDCYPKPSLESDIWAFGMTILEIFTGEVPYSKDPDAVVITFITRDHKLPDRPGSHITGRGLSDTVWALMNECWNQDSGNRPDAKRLTRSLRELSDSTLITAWEERTETVFIPNALVQEIIVSRAENWKTLDVRLVKENGTILQNNIPMAVIQVTGYATSVTEACLRIKDSIKRSAEIPATGQLRVPKEFHSRMIGQHHCHRRKLENKHGVQIKFPPKMSRSSIVKITGSAHVIEKAKEDLRKLLWFERNSRDVLKVSSRVAERVSEQRENILRPPLWGMKVEIHGEDGTITLRGNREGIIIAQKSIRAIEEKIKNEVTEEIPLDGFLLKMIESDPQAWIDIIKRCGELPSLGAEGLPFVQSISSHGMKVQGPKELMKALRAEVEILEDIGHAFVSAKKISARRHQSLLDTQGGLMPDLRKHAQAMVYFPTSGGYQYIGRPDDMDHYGGEIDFRDIVKVVGTSEECAKARRYLEARVDAEETRREKNPLYSFPAILYSELKRKLDPMLKTFGVVEESKVPTLTASLLCFVSQDKSFITASGPGWSIHERDNKASGKPHMCEMRLISDRVEDLAKAVEILEKEACTLWRRIGVLELQTLAHARLIKEKLGILEKQGNDLSCELVEKPGPVRLVIGGPSTNVVESVINSAVALVEAAGD